MEFNILKNLFSEQDAKQLNPLVLAYVGDAIYEVYIRTYLVSGCREMSVHKLHVKAIDFVRAHAQSEFMKKLMNELTEEEITIFKRGRNTKSATVPKNADIVEYRMATGFECLLGFLFLTNQKERVEYLLEKIVDLKETK